MGKPGFVPRVSANAEDSERSLPSSGCPTHPGWIAAAGLHGIHGMMHSIEQPHAEIGMRCGKSYPHAQHTWQMSATGWCACDGRESTPIYDGLVNARSSQF